jgi:cytochrome oxidase Cu insertion factor (SCO1/SenC/PrrC family)
VWWGLSLLVLVAAAAAVALASGGDDAKATKHEVSPRVTVDGTSLPAADIQGLGSGDDPAIGMTAPTLTGESFAGKNVTFRNDGKPRIVLFVFHGCPHCQAEVPRIVALQQAGKLEGVEIQTVSTGTDSRYDNYPPSAWLRGEQWPYPVLADDGKTRAANAYGLRYYPYFVLVDADGKVVGRATGEVSKSDLTKIVQALAAGDEQPLSAAA